MLVQRHRLWANIKPALLQRLVFGLYHCEQYHYFLFFRQTSLRQTLYVMVIIYRSEIIYLRLIIFSPKRECCELCLPLITTEDNN